MNLLRPASKRVYAPFFSFATSFSISLALARLVSVTEPNMPAEFFDAFFVLQDLGLGDGAVFDDGFADVEMRIPVGGDLGQVGDADDLMGVMSRCRCARR